MKNNTPACRVGRCGVALPFLRRVATLLFAGTLSVAAWAANTATQTVTFSVSAINELSVSGNPGALNITSAVAGSGPSPVSDATTTYAVTTNESNRKITGAIDLAMPSGVTLSVTLQAPTGASSAGVVSLSTSAADLVTGISAVNQSGRTITYQLSATTAAGTVSSSTRTVTLTLTAG